MKNLIIVFIICISISQIQSQSFEGKGDSKVSIGYNIYGYGNGIKVAYDYGLSNLFSIGLGSSFYFNNDENDYFIYARSNVHLGILMDLPPQFDIYPGVELGYLSRGDIGLSGYVGLKYFINKKIGIYAELGSVGSVGLSANL